MTEFKGLTSDEVQASLHAPDASTKVSSCTSSSSYTVQTFLSGLFSFLELCDDVYKISFFFIVSVCQ